MSKIFDLEQQIMNCWSVVDDIDMMYKHFGDDPRFAQIDAKHHDEIMNLVLGLKSLYQLKFDVMWGTFEQVCKEYHQYRNQCVNKEVL